MSVRERQLYLHSKLQTEIRLRLNVFIYQNVAGREGKCNTGIICK